MKLLAGAVLLLHLVFASGFAPARATPSSKPSRDWKRVVADDLEVVGNAPERDLRRALEEVQRFRDTLLALIPGLNTRAPERMVLVVLRDQGAFGRFTPRDGRGRRQEGVGGYFYTAPDANYIVLPMQANRDAMFKTVFHEYMHYLVYRNMRNVPRWLHEGIADLYSTFTVNSDGKVIIGKAPPGRIAALQRRPLLPLARFLDPESSARLFENSDDTTLFYSQAWAFVHFMTFGDNGKRQGEITKYLHALQSMAPAEAAKTAFGTDLRTLDNQLRTYTRRFQLPALVVNVTETRPQAAGRVDPVTEADALYTQGRLLLDVGAVEEAENIITRTLALDAEHARAGVLLGRLRLQQEREDEAIALLKELATERTGDFEPHYHLASALLSHGDYEGSLKSYERVVALKPESPSGWYGLSVSALALNRLAQAKAAMSQVQRFYSDPTWYFSRARFALGIGHNDAALADAQEYVRAAGWGEHGTPYAAFVAVIAHWRLNQRAEADALLTAVARVVRPKSWVARVVEYLQGGLTDAAFLDGAGDNGERTEAHAYIGVRLLLGGRPDEARKHFTWVKERGDRNYTEYALAVAELKRLDRP